MKVLHLSTAKTWRGGEQQLVYLCQGLNSSGTEQIIVCPEDSALAVFCIQKQLPFSTYNRTGNLISTLLNICYVIRNQKPSLLHTHDGKAHTLLFLLNIFSRKPIPLIVHRRVAFAKKTNVLSLFKYNHSSIRRIICVSDYIRKINLGRVKNAQKLSVVYDAIDSDKCIPTSPAFIRTELKIEESRFIIGNIAAFTAEKGHKTFVETAEKVLKSIPEAIFVLAGEGPLQKEIEALVEKKGIAGCFIFTGFIPDSHKYLAGFDVLLFPSIIEGLGTTILDAFACGVPVVTTRAGGIPEIVIHEETGLLAEVGDSSGLAENITRLYKSVELREKVKDGAKQLLTAFSIENMVENTLMIYKESMN